MSPGSSPGRRDVQFSLVTSIAIQRQSAADRLAAQLNKLPKYGEQWTVTSAQIGAATHYHRSTEVWVARVGRSSPLVAVMVFDLDIGLGRSVAVMKDFAADSAYLDDGLYLGLIELALVFAEVHGAVGLRLESTESGFQAFCQRLGFRLTPGTEALAITRSIVKAKLHPTT